MNRQRFAHLRRRIHKSIGKLRAQHRRYDFTARLERLSKDIPCVTTLRTHVARVAAIDAGIAKRIAPIHLQNWGIANAGAQKKEKLRQVRVIGFHLRFFHRYLNRTRETRISIHIIS